MRNILNITDDADIITNVFQGELVIEDNIIVEATDIVILDENFDNWWIAFRDNLRLYLLVILGVSRLAIALGVGLKSGSTQDKFHFSSTWIQKDPDITHENVDSKKIRKAWCGYKEENRVVSREFFSSVYLSNTGNIIAVSGRFSCDLVSVCEF